MRVVAIATGVVVDQRRVELIGGRVGCLLVAVVAKARHSVDKDLGISREMGFVARHTSTFLKGRVNPFGDFTLAVAGATQFRRGGFQQLRVSGGVGLVAPVALGAATVEMPLVPGPTRVIRVLGLHHVAGQTHARIPPAAQFRAEQVTIPTRRDVTGMQSLDRETVWRGASAWVEKDLQFSAQHPQSVDARLQAHEDLEQPVAVRLGRAFRLCVGTLALPTHTCVG
jgi:hypothetical protein